MRRKKATVKNPRNQRIKGLDVLTAAGGVLYSDSDNKSPLTILVIKRNGVWDLPKGKLEDGESIMECAAREVSEEVGIPLPTIEKFLCETYHEYEVKGEKVGKKTYWYSMKTDRREGLLPQKEEGITDLKWVDANKALDMVGYKNLEIVLDTYLKKSR